MLKCGLLGERLGHSYSPAIHAMLGGYEYRLFEKQPDELEAFLKDGDFSGLNVTIPYKKTVLPFCAELSESAAAIGSVNTIVRRADGSLFGDNTDAFGFERLVRRTGFDPAGKKAVILGSGGAMEALRHVLRQMGAEVVVISRGGEDNYSNLERHRDAALIVNATPVGTYPNNMRAAVDLKSFPEARCVLDIVYNPARTALLMQAEKLHIPYANGLYMLVAQAKKSSERFTGTAIDDGEIERIERVLSASMQNLVLIGMPGCGKSSVGKLLAEKLGRVFLDTDEEIVKAAGMSIPEIFAKSGEEGFRRIETQVLSELCKRSGMVIATGGGCVTRAENYPLLHQNSRICLLRREIEKLPTEGRPLSSARSPQVLYAEREPLYTRFADLVADNNGSIADTVGQIMEVLDEAAHN